MKQTSNSLLTLCPISLIAISIASALPRDEAAANNRHRTPFTVYRELLQQRCSILLGSSSPPRSSVRYRLGEERIRSLLHAICFSLLVICLMIPAARIALGAEGLVISLKEEATIQSSMISLKDVADLHGPDPHQLEKLARIPIGSSPEFGSVKILSRHQIAELIQAAVGPLYGGSIAGAAAVQIRLQGRPIDSSEIVPLLKSHLLETTPWKESEIEIRSLGNLKGIELPPGEVMLRLSSNTAIAGGRNLLAAVEIEQAGKILHCFWITAGIGIRARILVAATKILPGKIITPDDVAEKLTEITDLRAAYARNPEDLLGKVSRRSFRPVIPSPVKLLQTPFLLNMAKPSGSGWKGTELLPPPWFEPNKMGG